MYFLVRDGDGPTRPWEKGYANDRYLMRVLGAGAERTAKGLVRQGLLVECEGTYAMPGEG